MKGKNQFLLRRGAVGFLLVGLMMVPVAAQSFHDIPTNFDASLSETIIDEPHVEGEVLVKFKEKKIDMDQVSGRASLNAFVFAKGLNKEDTIAPQNVTLLSSKSNESTEELIDRLQDDSRVEYVVPNYLRKVFDISAPVQHIPNDTFFAKQWSLHNTAQDVNGIMGVNDADIDVPEAWSIFKGSSSTVVGVLDTGIDITHPDLVDNLWDGSAGCKDENGIAIPGGCPNHGWNFVDNVNGCSNVGANFVPNSPADDHGHGTHVSSIAAARGDNDMGISGVNMQAKIMAIKVADSCGSISSNSWIKGLNFAKQNGVKIVNASFGGFNFSQAEHDAIQDFPGLFVAAAGNGGIDGSGDDNDNPLTPNYPSNYDLNTVIAVAATDSSDKIASFSNYGKTSVDIAAPGVNIAGAFPDNRYVYSSGTSMASPHVAGLAALIWSYDVNLTATQVRDDILKTGDTFTQSSGKEVSTGKRINAYNALNGLKTVPAITGAVLQDDGVDGGVGKLLVKFTLADSVGGLPITLKQFEYSVDGGLNFSAPTNSDISGAMSVVTPGASWSANSYVTSSLTSGMPLPEYSFFVDLNHADLALKPLPPDVRIRFRTNNGVIDSDVVGSNDIMPPSVVTLSGAPSGFIKSKDASITVGGTDVASYAYMFDSGVITDFVNISKPLALSDLIDGSHTLSVYGKDENGNVQIHPTVAMWTVDTTPPVGTIAVATLSPMKTKTPQFTLAVSDGGVDKNDSTKMKVQLSCDGKEFFDPIDAVDTVTTFDVKSGVKNCSALDGERTLFAQFQDSLGNIGLPVKTDVFTVWAGPIVAQILTKPSLISAPAVTFTIGGIFVTAYKYRLDGVGDFSPEILVNAPLILSEASALSDGVHKIEFVAKSDVGDFQDAGAATSYSWTVDATPPAFALSGTPADGTTSTSASITVTGTADVIAYKFSFDAGPFSSETPVATPISLNSLGVGSHTVKVIVRDALGNYTAETNAISATWSVAAIPPVLVLPPPAPVVSAPASSGGGGFSSPPPVIFIPPALASIPVSVVPAPTPPSLKTGIVLGASTVNFVNGMVLKLEGRGLYYVIQDGKKRPIPYATYRKKYFKISRAIELPSGLLRKIPQFRVVK